MRPGEVCALRACDIDTGGRVWVYRPVRHKTEHHGQQREVYMGPRAQEVIRPWLVLDTQAYLFSPAAAEAARRAERRRGRKTPLTPSQARRRPKENPKRAKRQRYDETSYRNAVYRACDRAFPPPDPLAARTGETRAQWQARLTPAEREGLARWRSEIAEALEVSTDTVGRVRQRFVEQGLEAALGRKRQDRPSRQRKLDGAAEARLIALACSAPPDGRKAWTMRLLADRLAELEVVDAVSDETVRRAMKKTS
jgi:transposase